MRIVCNYDMRYHNEKELHTSSYLVLVKISHKLMIVVGSCRHGIQDTVCWQCLFFLMMQQQCWSSFVLSLEKHNYFEWSHDKFKTHDLFI